ncbi:MAG: SAM-dependent methyltransferase [Myxococcales bacterium]|nr:SAM-dependent methyltransferase [Myxococcales bacterium]
MGKASPLVNSQQRKPFLGPFKDETSLPLLKPRLAGLLRWVQPSWRVADIGTDHGHLPLHLVARGHTQHVLACDKNAAPLGVARENIDLYKPEGSIELRLGDGLAPLQDGEVDAITIAGMGRNSIERILRARDLHRLGLRYLLLQSNTQEELLRRFILMQGWILRDEYLVEDHRIFYVGHLVEIPSQATPPTTLAPEDWLFSEFLLGHPDELLRPFLEQKLSWLDDQCRLKSEDPPPSLGWIPPHAYRQAVLEHLGRSL